MWTTTRSFPTAALSFVLQAVDRARSRFAVSFPLSFLSFLLLLSVWDWERHRQGKHTWRHFRATYHFLCTNLVAKRFMENRPHRSVTFLYGPSYPVTMMP